MGEEIKKKLLEFKRTKSISLAAEICNDILKEME